MGQKQERNKALVVMPCDEKQLIARDQPHHARIPLTQRGAAVMICDSVRGIDSRKPMAQAAQTEIHVLEIRSVALVESIEAFENVATEDTGRPGRDGDGGGSVIPFAGARLSLASPPGTGGAAYQVVGAVDCLAGFRVEDGPGGKARFASGRTQTLQPAAIELDVAVEDRDPFRGGRSPSAVDGAGEAGILPHRDHAAAARASQVPGAVGRGVVDDYDFRERKGLGAHGVEQAFQQVRAIVDGDNRCEHSKL